MEIFYEYFIKKEDKSNYYDISKMMHGFGDHSQPNKDTVALVESITLNQLRLIVREASKYIEEDKKELRGEHLVFLMRKNKYKMRRFIKYLKNIEIGAKVQSSNLDINSLDESKNKLLKFIQDIDETGELTDIDAFDEVKTERMLRADRMSLLMSSEMYSEFSKTRNESFLKGKSTHGFKQLQEWIDPNKTIVFDSSTFEPLSYYANETVAQLIDYVYLLRQDQRLQGSYTSIHDIPKITVDEINEVMRRFHTQSGKLNFGGTSPEYHQILAI